MANMDLRLYAKGSGVPLWAVAKAMKVSEPTLTRRMRTELPGGEKAKIRKIIDALREAEQ